MHTHKCENVLCGTMLILVKGLVYIMNYSPELAPQDNKIPCLSPISFIATDREVMILM